MGVERTGLIIQALAMNGPQTYRQMLDLLGGDYRSLTVTVRKLVGLGVLEISGKDPVKVGKPRDIISLAPLFLAGCASQFMETPTAIRKTNP